VPRVSAWWRFHIAGAESSTLAVGEASCQRRQRHPCGGIKDRCNRCFRLFEPESIELVGPGRHGTGRGWDDHISTFDRLRHGFASKVVRAKHNRDHARCGIAVEEKLVTIKSSPISSIERCLEKDEGKGPLRHSNVSGQLAITCVVVRPERSPICAGGEVLRGLGGPSEIAGALACGQIRAASSSRALVSDRAHGELARPSMPDEDVLSSGPRSPNPGLLGRRGRGEIGIRHGDVGRQF